MGQPFEIIPAIDLRNGRCVRLRQGAADAETVYEEDPVAVARRWAAEGAQRIHVVDLDGAFQGKPVHTALIAAIVHAVGVPVQTGGGLRTDEDIDTLLDFGVDRVIVGTRILSDPAGVGRLAARIGDRLAVGIDARDGMVRVKGWVEATSLTATDAARAAEAAGVKTVIFTDTSRDGMLAGVNVAAMSAMCDAVKCRVVASGGVASPADVAALVGTGRKNLEGVIVGKALYDGKVTMKELLEAAKTEKAQKQ